MTRAGSAPDLALVTGLDEFLGLRDEWDALFARAARPWQVFQSHVFLRHWARHYLDGRSRLAIVTGRREGRLAMLWPLVRQRGLGFETLRFMGVPVAQYGDVLVEPGDDAQALLGAGRRMLDCLGADLFEARKLRADSVLALSGLLAGAGAREREQAPFVALGRRVDGEGLGPAYSARERSNHRRRLRRLAEAGEFVLSRLEPGPEAAGHAGEAVALKLASLSQRGIVAPAIADPRFRAFFTDLAGDAEGGSPLRLSIVARGERAIGIDLALDCKGWTFGHVLATDPEHERAGIGRILAHHSFAGARLRGASVFDLLAPADAYKHDHADGMTELADWTLPLTLKGRLAGHLGLGHLRPALKAASKRLPAGLGRRIAAWNTGAKG